MKAVVRWLPVRLLFALLIVSSANWGICVELPTSAPEDVGLSAERLQRIDSAIGKYIEENRISGAVMLVARKGKVAHHSALGMMDIEDNKPMGTDTIFRLASMSKAITGVATLMLYEEGRFELNDPLDRFIPAFKNMQVLVTDPDQNPYGSDYELVPANGPIRIRQLLNHTAGFAYGLWGQPYFGELYQNAGIHDGLYACEGTIGDMVERLARLPLMHHPGEVWEYGVSVDVLGRLIEVVSGMPLDRFFEERIFEPLGMEDTYFYLPKEKASRLAAVYAPNEDGGISKTTGDIVQVGSAAYTPYKHIDGPRTYFSGGAGLVSTASDYARFLQMLLNGGELEGHRLLSRKTVESMTSNQIGDLDVAFAPIGDKFGLGVSINENPDVTRSITSKGTYSWGGFFYTHFFVDPHEDMLGLIMIQLYPYSGPNIHAQFDSLVYQAIND